jgi:predicted ATPase
MFDDTTVCLETVADEMVVDSITDADIRIKELRLTNWRNFKQVRMRLQKRVFLVGPNASGKSNVLDALRFLHDVVSVGGGFQEAVMKRGGVSSIRSLSARKNSNVMLGITVGDDENDFWDYELCFNQDSNNSPKIVSETLSKDGLKVYGRPDSEDRNDSERLTQTYIQQVTRNKEFRELANILNQIFYIHLVPQLVREPSRSVRIKDDPFGGDFLEKIASTPEKVKRARLKAIENALKLAVPQLNSLGLSKDEKGITHLRAKYDNWRPEGAYQNEFQLSDGTIRLFGFLWAIQEGTGTLLLEEPELSLHPAVVRSIPQIIAQVQGKNGRQIILSTHSKEMLDDEGIGLDEVMLLIPSKEGTKVMVASEIEDAKKLLDGGNPLSDIVIPITAPLNIEQLKLSDF